MIRIRYGSDRYTEEIALREKVLRIPLGMRFSQADLEAETDELRFGLLDERKRLAACLLVRRVDGSTGKLRQMAVREDLRGKGIGRELVLRVESELKKAGIHFVVLHARRVAEGFYAKLGYTPSGEPFTEVGIPHIKMEKTL